MREKAIKNTIICAYKNLKSKAYKKIVMALMIFIAVIQVGIISNNKIKDINSLKNLVNIEYLGLNYNKIKDVEVLQNLKNLKMSGISKNMINDLSKLSELNLEGGFFPWDQIIIVNAKATSENTYELDLNLLKDRNDNKINITNLNTGIYDKERNIIKWSDLQLPHNTTFQFNNGLLVYENNSFYGTVIVKIK